jgi:hypothetical protein
VRIFTAVFLCAICAASQAADRPDKIRELMNLQGLVKMFDQQLEASRERTRDMANQTLDKGGGHSAVGARQMPALTGRDVRVTDEPTAGGRDRRR